MASIIAPWLIQTVAMLLTAALLPKLRVTSIFGAILAVAALGFINTKIWDAALFFQIPDGFTSHAVALLLANGVLFWVVVKILPGIEIDGLLPALVAPIVFTVFSLVLTRYGKDIDWEKVADKTMEEVTAVASSAKSFINSTKEEVESEKK